MPSTKLACKTQVSINFPLSNLVLACTACSDEIDLVSFLAQSQRYYQFRPVYSQSVPPFLTRNSLLLELNYTLQTNSYSVVYLLTLVVDCSSYRRY
jgi:hypothetical protein